MGNLSSGSFYLQFGISTRLPAGAPAGPAAGAYDILAKNGGASQSFWQLYLTTSGTVEAQMYLTGTASTVYVYSNRAVNDGAFHTVLLRRTAGNLCIVIDSSNLNVSCSAMPDVAIANTAPVTVGDGSGYENTTTGPGPNAPRVRPFVGLIDNLYLGADPLR
jgi:hypothetical protein